MHSCHLLGKLPSLHPHSRGHQPLQPSLSLHSCTPSSLFSLLAALAVYLMLVHPEHWRSLMIMHYINSLTCGHSCSPTYVILVADAPFRLFHQPCPRLTYLVLHLSNNFLLINHCHHAFHQLFTPGSKFTDYVLHAIDHWLPSALPLWPRTWARSFVLIISVSFFMATLRSRCKHYIFVLFLSSSSWFFFLA